MTVFVTFTAETSQTPQVVTAEAYYAGEGLPKDWSDYIWQEADSAEIAVKMHDKRLDEYNASVAGMSVEDYIEFGDA